ncbi:hypothetical protein FISHEDRAFT_59213 [Fistulina hepatica ATCC 64428]|uniref:SLC26A/SulP transporter domain-containing protein n=1 Tax=Fistulina hepatica ATCC 64428 TaxID=1128425 RepID=A0A0D7ACE2_9AGAR|nr:hypothetical protein FISHEDRAFT_59213 [Fistulina hepatica ATCC 64428]
MIFSWKNCSGEWKQVILVAECVFLRSLYGCTPAFYWIPSAALSAAIFTTVANLVTQLKQVYAFIRASPIEAVIWFAEVMITSTDARDLYVPLLPPHNTSRPAPAPISSSISVTSPAPGVIVYRFEESAIHPNIARSKVAVVACARATTRRGQTLAKNTGDRPWNDSVPSVNEEEEAKRPKLSALMLDFGKIAHMDVTAVQALVDMRSERERQSNAHQQRVSDSELELEQSVSALPDVEKKL